ncbi:MAG: ankyrin repeat domain-containing protein [Bacteroidota bacterium]
MQAGADPNIRNRRGQTALHIAAWNGHSSVARQLGQSQADVNARSEHSGETPLHTAVRANRVDMVVVLLQAGARSSLRTLAETSPDIRGNRHPAGVTAREIAERAGFDEIVRIMGGVPTPLLEPEAESPDG